MWQSENLAFETSSHSTSEISDTSFSQFNHLVIRSIYLSILSEIYLSIQSCSLSNQNSLIDDTRIDTNSIFFFDLSINYNNDDHIVYRNVKLFVKQVISRKNANSQYVVVYCLQNFAYEWFKNLVEFTQKYVIKNLNILCNKLVEIFDSKEQKQRIQQQVEEVRITKKQRKIEIARLKVFACKRCSVKFSNNTKFHQHIQNHYQKKFANKLVEFTSNELAIHIHALIAFFIFSRNEFANSISNEFTIFSSNSKFTSKAMFVEFTSSELAKLSLFSFTFFAKRCAFYINYSFIQYFSSSQLLNANFIFKQNSNMSN